MKCTETYKLHDFIDREIKNKHSQYVNKTLILHLMKSKNVYQVYPNHLSSTKILQVLEL